MSEIHDFSFQHAHLCRIYMFSQNISRFRLSAGFLVPIWDCAL